MSENKMFESFMIVFGIAALIFLGAIGLVVFGIVLLCKAHVVCGLASIAAGILGGIFGWKKFTGK